jgi:hypothetical protein
MELVQVAVPVSRRRRPTEPGHSQACRTCCPSTRRPPADADRHRRQRWSVCCEQSPVAGLAEGWRGQACRVARAGPVTLMSARPVWTARRVVAWPSGRPARTCRSGSSWSVRRCPTPPRPLRAGAGPGAGQCSVDSGPAAARPGRRGVVAGGVRSSARWLAVGSDRGGRAKRWTWRTRSAATSPEPFPQSARRHVAAASGIILGAVLMYGRCAGLFISIRATIWPSNCRTNNLPP